MKRVAQREAPQRHRQRPVRASRGCSRATALCCSRRSARACRCARSQVDGAAAARHRRADRRAARRPRAAATSSRANLAEVRARARGAAVGAQRRGAPRVARPPRGDARGARGARALGRTTALVNTYGELFDAQRRRASCRCSSGPRAPRARSPSAISVFRQLLAPIEAPSRRRCCSRRGARGRLRTLPDRPALTLELGRDQPRQPANERLARFVAVYPAHRGTPRVRASNTSTCAIRTASRCACRRSTARPGRERRSSGRQRRQ